MKVAVERGPVSKKRGDYKTMNITSIDFDETITKENSSSKGVA